MGFWKSAGIRAIKTVFQTAASLMSVSTFIQEINWISVLSASLLSGLISICTSIATGLPEVNLAQAQAQTAQANAQTQAADPETGQREEP